MNNRVSSFFGEELILGSFISRTVAIPLYLIFNLNFNKKITHYIIIITISIILVTISAERASFFILLTVIFFSLFYLRINQIIYLLLCILILISSTILINKKSYERLIKHTFSQIVVKEKINYPSYRHQLHYLSAFKIYQDHKIIGSGIKSFRVLCNQNEYNLDYKIEKDHKVKSNINGIILMGKFNKKETYWIKTYSDDELSNPKFQNAMVFKFGNLDNYYNSLKTYGKLNPTTMVDENNFFKPYFKNFQKIKKGQFIYSRYEFKNGCNTHPHNFYLQFLAELGIIGFFFLLLTYFYIIWKILQKLLNKFKYGKLSTNFILYSNYLAVLFPLIPSGNFFNNYLSLLIFLPLCMFKLCYTK